MSTRQRKKILIILLPIAILSLAAILAVRFISDRSSGFEELIKNARDLENQGFPAKAIRTVQKAKATAINSKESFMANYVLGILYMKHDLFFNAMESFQRALRSEPWQLSAYIKLADVYNRIGLTDLTISLLGKNISGPGETTGDAVYANMPRRYRIGVFMALGRAYLHKKDYINALKYLEKADTAGADILPKLLTKLRTVVGTQATENNSEEEPEIMEEELAAYIESRIASFEEYSTDTSPTPSSPMEKTSTDIWKGVEQKYPEGAIVSGKISDLSPYGITVLLDGSEISGFISPYDISWDENTVEPEAHFSKGESVEAKVLTVSEDSQFIKLGIKQLTEDPWLKKALAYNPGQIVTVKVIKKVPSGLTVEIEEGVTSFISTTKIRLDDNGMIPEDIIPGSKMDVVVIDIDPAAKKIVLSEPSEKLEQPK